MTTPDFRAALTLEDGSNNCPDANPCVPIAN